ncbi:rCG36399, partial [Rattus norvegicus]
MTSRPEKKAAKLKEKYEEDIDAYRATGKPDAVKWVVVEAKKNKKKKEEEDYKNKKDKEWWKRKTKMKM